MMGLQVPPYMDCAVPSRFDLATHFLELVPYQRVATIDYVVDSASPGLSQNHRRIYSN